MMIYPDPTLALPPDEQERASCGMGEAERIRIGEKIRLARIKANLSQQELAERADILQRQVSLIERGKLNMTFDTLARVAAALNVPTHDLVKP